MSQTPLSQTPFNSDWLQQFSDPFAVLGVSVTADDNRVLKRYRTIARLLHPDTYIQADPAVRDRASQLFARLINPAYQKLRQSQGRADNLATLRFRVRRMSREEPFIPQSAIAQQLMYSPPAETDIFYEQAVTQLAEDQYRQPDQFEEATLQLGELNLVYLRSKMGEPIIRERSTGIVPFPPPNSPQVALHSLEPEVPSVDYGDRHFERAKEYLNNSNWNLAVRELRDAIRINPNRSEYHAYLGKAYLMQDLPIMAKVHFRQALRLDPGDTMALEYARRLQISIEATNTTKAGKNSGGGFFGLFARRR